MQQTLQRRLVYITAVLLSPTHNKPVHKTDLQDICGLIITDIVTVQ